MRKMCIREVGSSPPVLQPDSAGKGVIFDNKYIYKYNVLRVHLLLNFQPQIVKTNMAMSTLSWSLWNIYEVLFLLNIFLMNIDNFTGNSLRYVTWKICSHMACTYQEANIKHQLSKDTEPVDVCESDFVHRSLLHELTAGFILNILIIRQINK